MYYLHSTADPGGFNNLLAILKKFTILAALYFSVQAAFGQTPGLIVKPAGSAAGIAVLDPNGDGYVSAETGPTPLGFTSSDEGLNNSEIPYRPIPLPPNEVLSDLLRGPGGGFTDFSFVGSNVNPVYTYTTNEPADADKKLLFRFRLGGIAPNSKGYSILIDTDGRFGNTGANLDPNYTPTNPGFEVEIVLATNFFVYLYNVDGTSSASTLTPLVSLPYNDYAQKAVALTTQGGNPDYFYDFYIPFSQIPTALFTPSTPLRMVANTVMSPHSAIKGPISDVGGVDDATYANSGPNAWTYIVTNQVPSASTTTTTNPLPAFKSDPPIVNSPITINSTSISGTTTEGPGTIITIYKNGVAICGGTPACFTTTAASGTSWSLTVPAGSLAVNDQILATATAPGESVSNTSNVVIVASAPPICTSTAPTPTWNCASTLGMAGTITGSTLNVTNINVYQVTATGATLYASNVIDDGQGRWGWRCHQGWQYQAANNSCNQGNTSCVPTGSYFAIATETGKCASPISEIRCVPGVTAPGAPVISTNPILTTTTTITGTHTTANRGILIFVNNYYKGSTTSAATASGGTFAWSFSGLALNAGDVITTFATVAEGCVSTTTTTSTRNVTAATLPQSSPPVINGPIYAGATTITGTSSEAFGTAIAVYRAGVLMCGGAGQPTCPTVSQIGTWTLSGIAPTTLIAGNNITALATAPGKSVSGVSNTRTVLAIPAAPAVPAISGSYFEQGTSVTGTGPANTAINVYIDRALLGTVTSNGSGAWTLSGLNAAFYDLYAGGVLTATAGPAMAPGESAHSAGVTVQCNPGLPATNRTVAPATTAVCPNNTAEVYILSEPRVIYTLRNNDNTADMGASMLGTGDTIRLTSFPLANTTSSARIETLRVRAQRTESTYCTAVTLTQSAAITVNPNPATSNTVTASPSTICSGSFALIDVESTNDGYAYQLRRSSDNSNVGNPVYGADFTDITLNTGTIAAATNYNILVTDTITGCFAQLTTTPAISISGSTSAFTNNAYANSPAECGRRARIVVESSSPAATYQLMNMNTNTLEGVARTGTGDTLTLASLELFDPATFRIVRTDGGGCSAISNADILYNVVCDPNFPLPVKLINFSASVENGDVLLSWATASEKENDYFDVQRSYNGRDFTKIGRVAGSGTSDIRQTYTLTDKQPLNGVNYYRLRQVDFNGEVSLSNVTAVTIKRSIAETLIVSPNPVRTKLALELIDVAAGEYVVQVYDLFGHKISEKKMKVAGTTGSDQLDFSHLPDGMYMLSITGDQTRLVKQIIKQ